MAEDKITQVIDIISNMTVLELNELRKALEEKFDVKAAAPVAMAVAPAAGGAAAAEEESSEVSVLIKDFGAKKIDVIKVVRSATGAALKDAKEIVESGGSKPVKEGIEKPEAEKLAKELEAAGATVEIK